MKIPDVIFSAGLDRALGWTMLHSIWQATLIALIAGIILLVIRRQSAQMRYIVANLALLAILLTSVATFSYYLRSAPMADNTVAVNEQQPLLSNTHGTTKTIIYPIAQDVIVPTIAENNMPKSFHDYFTEHLPLIVAIWFLGMTVFLCRLLGGISRVYYLRSRMNFHADPYWADVLSKFALQSKFNTGIELLESALVRSPLTIGHLKPVILFPIGLINRLSESEVEAILAHELAHILRRDYIFNILQSVVEVVFYFHPAVWWLSNQVRQERESACDDQAIALLGDKLNYAKALVTIQEMAFLPMSPALAFAGTKRSQLLVRVHRLFSPPTTKFNIMEKWIATGLVVCSLMVLAFGQHIQNNNIVIENASFSHNSGLWEAEFNGDSVCMNFSSKTKEGNWMNGECFAKNNFTNLSLTPGETAFQMIRPAGTMSMTGKIEGTSGYGRFEFTPNESYRTNLTQNGVKEVDDELLIHCFFANLPNEFISFLKKTGYSTVSRDELLQLAIFRLDEVAIRGYLDLATSLGKKNVPLQQLVELKIANVSPETVGQLAKAGYKDLDLSDVSALSLQNVSPAFIDSMNSLGFGKLSMDDVMSAKIHGIDADFVKQWQNTNFGKLSFDDIMSAKIQGLDADFVKQWQNTNFGKLSFDDLMSAKIQGLDPEFIKQAQSLGFPNLSFDDMMSMKIQGIDADFVKKAQSLGFENLSFDDIMSMKIQGIDADFIKQCQNIGFGKLSFDDVMSMKIHGITPEFVKQCQEIGLRHLNLDDVMSMKIHGIDAAFVKEAKQMDLGELSLDDLMNIRIHGVTSEFAKSFRDIGFKNLTVDDLVTARIHNVTPEFIKESNKKGYSFPTLEEYSDLKIRNQSRPKRAE